MFNNLCFVCSSSETVKITKMFNESWTNILLLHFCCLRFVTWTTAVVQSVGSMISNHHYTARNYHRVALKCIIQYCSNSADSRNNALHMLTNTNERKNKCDVWYTRFSCKLSLRQNVTRWDLFLFEQIPGNVLRKNVWPALCFVFDHHQLTM